MANPSVGARDLLTTGLSPNATPDYHQFVANGNFFLETLGDEQAQYTFDRAKWSMPESNVTSELGCPTVR